MLVRLLVLFIRIYRWTISPLLGPVCRFHPSCSRYAEGCLLTHGPFYGSLLALKRLAKCHPFHPGGVDPVPPRTEFEPERRMDRDSSARSLALVARSQDGQP